MITKYEKKTLFCGTSFFAYCNRFSGMQAVGAGAILAIAVLERFTLQSFYFKEKRALGKMLLISTSKSILRHSSLQIGV